jgi:hypothetical protein
MKAFPNMAGQQGMDLRDYFAAKAMQAYLTGDYDLYPNEVAEKAYQVADWMIKTRKAK